MIKPLFFYVMTVMGRYIPARQFAIFGFSCRRTSKGLLQSGQPTQIQEMKTKQNLSNILIRKTKDMHQQEGSSTSTRVGIKGRRKFRKEKTLDVTYCEYGFMSEDLKIHIIRK